MDSHHLKMSAPGSCWSANAHSTFCLDFAPVLNVGPQCVTLTDLQYLHTRTINPNLSISVFVRSFEEGFCLVVSQISTLLGKPLQNVPVGGSTEGSQSHTPQHIFGRCVVSIVSRWFVSVRGNEAVELLLEFILFYKAASIHIQNPEDLLDLLCRHGRHPDQIKELFGVERLCCKKKEENTWN